MNPQVPDELISAYFDGEVTPEERVAVERLLAESDEAQRTLNETSRLSGLLHSFPRESAPLEMVSKIRQLTDQLPLVPQSKPVASAPAPNRWREVKAALISAVTTAAGILIVWTIADRSDPSHAVALNHLSKSAMEVAPASAPAEPTPKMDQSVASADLGTAERKSAKVEDLAEFRSKAPLSEAAKQSAPMPAAPMRSGIPLSASAGAPAPSLSADSTREAGAAKKAEATMSPKDAPSFAGIQAPAEAQLQTEAENVSNLVGVSNEEFVNGLNYGNVYSVASPDNNVGVVELTVIDIEKGAETIQVLLKRREIPQRANDTDTAIGRAKRQTNSDSLVVVYAVAPGDRLAKMLKDIESDRETFLQWNSQPPLQLPANPEYADRKQADVSNPLAKGDSQTEALKPGAGGGVERFRKELDGEEAETEQIVKAYVGRNLMVQNATVANATANAAPGSPVADATKEGVAQHQEKLAANARNMRGGPGIRAVESRDGMNPKDQVAQGYKLLHVPTTKSQDQNVFNNLNVAQNNPDMFHNGRRLAQDDKSTRAESGSRAVRMLFVLHANQPDAAPADAVPAKPQ